RVEGGVALLLDRGRQPGAELRKSLLAHLLFQVGVELRRGDCALRLADLTLQVLLERDQGLEPLVRGEQCFQDDLLREHVGAALDHDHGVAATGDDQVEVALEELAGGGIDDEAPTDAAHADGGDRATPWHVGENERRGGTDERQHVGVVLLVVREHRRDDLRLAVEALRKEWSDRAVDQTGGEYLLLRRPTLALEKAARDLARRERLLLIVTGEREEIDSFPRRPTGRRRDQHDRLAKLDERCAAG